MVLVPKIGSLPRDPDRSVLEDEPNNISLCRSSSSAYLRSKMFLLIPNVPMIAPVSSRRGIFEVSDQPTRPSAKTSFSGRAISG